MAIVPPIISGNCVGILDLPPELFEEVAEKVKINDLSNLRLVNHEFESKSRKLYGKGRFSSVAVLLCSEEALRKLHAITKSERFGPYIRTISLCVGELCFDPWHKPECAAALAKQNAFKESSLDSLLLTSAFCCLRQYGNSLNVEITAIDSCDLPIILGYKALSPLMFIGISSDLAATQSCVMVMDAIILAQPIVKAFCIYGGEDEMVLYWPTWLEAKGNGMMKRMSNIFSGLDALSLESYESSGVLESYQAQAIIATLSGSATLKDLSLHPRTALDFHKQGPQSKDGNQELAKALLEADLPAVESLALSGFLFDFEAFAGFVGRQSRLRSLDLRDIVFCNAPIAIPSGKQYEGHGLDSRQARWDEIHSLYASLTKELSSLTHATEIAVSQCTCYQ